MFVPAAYYRLNVYKQTPLRSLSLSLESTRRDNVGRGDDDDPIPLLQRKRMYRSGRVERWRHDENDDYNNSFCRWCGEVASTRCFVGTARKIRMIQDAESMVYFATLLRVPFTDIMPCACLEYPD